MPDLRTTMNHLMGRRRGRRPPPPTPPPPMPPPPGLHGVLDCYLDYLRADPSVRIDVCEVAPEPCIVCCATTGYIEQCSSEAASSVLLAAGQDGSTE
jgi:hypothetical protein